MNCPSRHNGLRLLVILCAACLCGQAHGLEAGAPTGLADGGAFGSIMGRNAFQRPLPEALELLKSVQEIYRNAK